MSESFLRTDEGVAAPPVGDENWATASVIDVSGLTHLDSRKPRLQEFNRFILDRKDPFESQGAHLPQFELSLSYPVNQSELPKVIAALFHEVPSSFRGKLPGVQIEIVDFRDARIQEEPRRYLIVSRETSRKTRMALYSTFQSFGESLYVAVDCFILPPVSVARVLIMALLTFAFLLQGLLTIIGFPLAVAACAWYYRDVIRSLRHGEPLDLAIRRKFHKPPVHGTFNTDDILKFYKSALPLLLEGMQVVFKKHGIPVDVIEQAMQNIYFVNNINTNGGSFVGNLVNGIRNKVTGNVSSVSNK